MDKSFEYNSASVDQGDYRPLLELSRRFDYAKDYLGILARAGKIDAKKSANGQWFASESAVRRYHAVAQDKKSLIPSNGSSISRPQVPYTAPSHKSSSNAEGLSRLYTALTILVALWGGVFVLVFQLPDKADSLVNRASFQYSNILTTLKDGWAMLTEGNSYADNVPLSIQGRPTTVTLISPTVVPEGHPQDPKEGGPQPVIVREMAHSIIKEVSASSTDVTDLVRDLTMLDERVSAISDSLASLSRNVPTVMRLPDSNTRGGGIQTLNPSRLESTTLNVSGSSSLASLALSSDFSVDTNVLKIDTTLNRVGINTSSLDTAFEVVGIASISSNLYVWGNIGIGTSTVPTQLTVVGSGSFTGQLKATRAPTLAHTGTWPSFTNFNDATLYLNPSNPTADGNVIAYVSGSSPKFVVDAEGDIFGGSLILTGTTTTGTTTTQGDLTVEGNTQLGDASGDKIKFVGTILPYSLATIPFSVKASASQTVDVFRVKDSSDNVLLTVDQGSGLIYASSGFNFGGGASVASVSYSRLGSATTGHSLANKTDFLVSGLLETDGNAFFDAKASISSNLQISGRFIADTLASHSFTGDLTISKEFVSSGTASNSFAGSLLVSKGFNAQAIVGTSLIINTGNIIANGTGSQSFSGGLEVSKGVHAAALSATGNLVVAGSGNFNSTSSNSFLGSIELTKGFRFGNLVQTGTANNLFAGSLGINSGTALDTKFEVGGTASISGNIFFGSNASISGRFTVGGTGSSSFAGSLTVAKGLVINGTASNSFAGSLLVSKGFNAQAIVGTSLTISGNTRFNGVTYTWPSADGSANQFLKTNGSGTLSWGTAGVSSNSLDFDEFVNTMTLDANLTINRGGFFIGLGATPGTVFEVQGTASASYLLTGNTLQVGGFASVAYSRFGTSTTGHSNYISTTNDLLVSGDLEVRGSISANIASSSLLFTMNNTASASHYFQTNGSGGTNQSLFSIGVGNGTERLNIFNNTNSPMFTIASTGNVGVGTTGPGTTLDVRGNITILADSDIRPTADSTTALNIANAAGTDFVIFDTTNSRVGIGTTPNYKFHLAANVTTQMARFVNDGNNTNRVGIAIQNGAYDASGTNEAIQFDDGDGTTQGLITFSGGTVTYGAFTANHDVSVPEADNAAGYPYGTLMCIKNTFLKNNQERGIEYNVEKCSEPYAKNVLGAYAGKYASKANLHQVYVLGDGHILVNGEGGDIHIGDLITTSSTTGIGMKATEFGLTIGVAQENYTFSDPQETKLVAVQYGLMYANPDKINSESSLLTQDSGAIFDINILFNSILAKFEQAMGVMFKNGLIQTVKGIFQNVEVQQGVTVHDRATGTLYCIGVQNGTSVTTLGACDTQAIASPPAGGSSTPTSTPTPSPSAEPTPEPSVSATPTPTPTESPSPTPTPEISSTPEPTPEPTP